MPETTLAELLERNARHVDSLPDGHFSAVEAGQEPAAVSVCCSDSRVSQEGMWDVTEPGFLFTPSTIGNQVWDRYDGDIVVDGSVLYPVTHTDTGVILVVGHTGCGAVTAALDAVRRTDDGSDGDAAGIAKWIDLLVPVIEDGLADDRVDPDREASLVDQLVEYNVDRQVQFLLESDDVPDEETVYGFVYDFQGVYGDDRGRAYLVNADGETQPDHLRELVDEEFTDRVLRLL
ncbi:Carbonic anhydrase [Halalkaliarchaeum sp. AArc-CO]|uniref:carbonic anhydrase n=1 Tax=unclassified Halalkaliarchaeum TaxID=2678344 RepID=UPI00217E9642|nr:MULTISPECIES: carbonic anhydrase [unclassified Halalkaliarchaeum]MDR5673252.1 carbonic anhydrase [Halalkaliarchaeum sp. AArc-GB]UWG51788.1 Carbonic anhydrase [Halalkaliarchaeum sp. AArc-CO]